MELPGVTEHVIEIVKYFHKNHFPRAKFNENKEKKKCWPKFTPYKRF